MRRVLKAVVSNAPIGDVTTLEDETSVEEVKQVYEEFKKSLNIYKYAALQYVKIKNLKLILIAYAQG